jgi:hypothetical protein
MREDTLTPNGVIAVALISSGLMLSAPGVPGLAVLLAFTLAFAAIEIGAAAATALRRAVVVVLPLAVFMLLVWVGIVGRGPAEIAAGGPGSRTAALAHVGAVCGRLLFVVAVIQLVFLRFRDLTPLQFVRSLALPLAAKRLLILTLSLIATLRHAVDRAHVALIAAGTLTRAPSLRNLVHAWRMIQTVWLTSVTIALGRLRDKWPVENTLGLLDHTLARRDELVFGAKDRIWVPLAFGVAAAIIAVDHVRAGF